MSPSPARQARRRLSPIMPILRLLADDLTGALDTSVEFVGLCGPIEIGLGDDLAVDGKACLAIDSGTRERSAAEAVAVVERFAPLLKGGGYRLQESRQPVSRALGGGAGGCLSAGVLAALHPRVGLSASWAADAGWAAICANAGRVLAGRQRRSGRGAESRGIAGVPCACRKWPGRRRQHFRCGNGCRSRWNCSACPASARAGPMVRHRRAGASFGARP